MNLLIFRRRFQNCIL
uniref:Uncharacterized protein n=1 Tax=Lepeophtheirus salmonis TaxID=72036 RepID=A0A0K2VJW2_LEPSM